MPAQRYYYPAPLHLGEVIYLNETEQKHLIQVMRARCGEIVEIVNGLGQLAEAALLPMEQKKAPLKIIKIVADQLNYYPTILCQAIPKSHRLDMIVEKAVELGSSQIWLFPGEQSEKTEISAQLISRLEAISIAALKQCGRLFLPKICIKSPLKEWKDCKLPIFFGDFNENAPFLSKAWSKERYPDGVMVVIGPEKGLSTKEIAKLQSMDAVGVKLHVNILRTETASLVALSLIQHNLI